MEKSIPRIRSERRIRLLWLIDSLATGGAERLVASFARHLDRQRFDFLVCSLAEIDGNPMAAELERGGVRVILLGLRNLRDLAAFRRLVRLIRREKIDLIHTHLLYADIWGAVAGMLAARPVLSTLHVTEDSSDAGKKERLRQGLARWMARRWTRKVIAVSEAVQRHCVDHNRLPAGRVVTIHNGIALHDFSLPATFDRDRKREGLRLPPNVPVIITVAVLRPGKGHEILLRAAPRILSEFPEARFLIVGNGPLAAELEHSAVASGLAQRVIFTGLRRDIAELLAISELFVLPTLRDAFPTTLLEAMAMRLPVVASRVGGVPEIVAEEFTGLLVAPNDSAALGESIVTLLRDPSRMTKMGARGRARVEAEFSAEVWARRIEHLYETCLEEK